MALLSSMVHVPPQVVIPIFVFFAMLGVFFLGGFSASVSPKDWKDEQPSVKQPPKKPKRKQYFPL